MYKTFQKNDWIRMLKLPEDYAVDGLLICGSYSKEKELEILHTLLSEGNYEVKEEKIEENFFQKVNVYVINGKRIWFEVVYGGAYQSEIVHLASVFGSKANIFIGSCGGLAATAKTGDIVLPTFSYGDESTTRLYQRDTHDNKHFVTESLVNKIRALIPEKVNILRGGIVTCQAMLAETKEDIEGWIKEGYVGVEMETSTFIAISNHFNVPNAALLHISDNLITEELAGGESYKSTKELREYIKKLKYKIVLDVLLNK